MARNVDIEEALAHALKEAEVLGFVPAQFIEDFFDRAYRVYKYNRDTNKWDIPVVSPYAKRCKNKTKRLVGVE